MITTMTEMSKEEIARFVMQELATKVRSTQISILITGATGTVGSEIVTSFRNRDKGQRRLP
jgi:FlaA1/EpsC-like NDP-sugar epimerase